MIDFIEQLDKDNSESIKYFKSDLKYYYIGNPTPALLDGIKIEYYGEYVPLDRCSTVSVRTPEMLLVVPYEKKLAKDIERAIHKANLGLNPQADSDSVKVYLPKRTKESDIKIFKLIKGRAEKARVGIRHNRQIARDKLHKSDLSEDEIKTIEKEIQDKTNESIDKINDILERKRKDMRV